MVEVGGVVFILPPSRFESRFLGGEMKSKLIEERGRGGAFLARAAIIMSALGGVLTGEATNNKRA
jgi:hypothetical protein